MKVFSQLEKAQLENTTSDTASHPKGMATYRTDINQVKVSNGTTYKLMIDEDSSQALSNKTLASPVMTGALTGQQISTPSNPSSGYNKVYFKSDGKLYTLDTSGNEALIGSGSGGVKNLITNGNADDTAASIFTAYADTGTRPVDGTGGSPSVTTSVSSSSPLNGTKSFLLTKPASNVQGEGWSVAFTVDPAYRAKALKISLDYIINSGTFSAGSSSTDGDVIWYIYDVTNSALIEPSNIKVFSNSSSIASTFEATFQTSATGASYRLIAHVASTSASAFELKVDNVTVSPQIYVFGSPVTDWVSYTPTWTNLSIGNGTQTFKWRRVGDGIEITGHLQWGSTTSASGTFYFSLPSGLSVDNTKMKSDSARTGLAWAFDGGGGTNNREVYRVIQNGTNNRFFIAGRTDGGTSISFDATNPFTWGTSDELDMQLWVPILGWSSSVQMSDQADTRIISAVVSRSASQSLTATLTKVAYNSVNYDSHNLFDTTNNRYVVSTSGDYEFSAMFSFSTSSSSGVTDCFLYKNGSAVANRQQYIPISSATLSGGSVTFKDKAVAGDYYEIFLTSQFTVTLNSSSLNINRLSGPSAIAANDTTGARYTSTAGTAIPNSEADYIPVTKVYDYTGAYNTSTGYNCGNSGLYEATLQYITATFNTASILVARIQKNGVTQASSSTIVASGVAGNYTVRVSCKIRCVAGDIIKGRHLATSGSPVQDGNADSNFFEITRIGNY